MEFVKLLPLFLLIIVSCAQPDEFSKREGMIDNEAHDENDNFAMYDDIPANDSPMPKNEKKKLIKLLSSEGKPGWFKKMSQPNDEPNKSGDEDNANLAQDSVDMSVIDQDVSFDAIKNLNKKLSGLKNPLADNLKTSLNDLETKWSSLSDDEQSGIQGTLTTITSKFDVFINAGDNPVAAIQGAIDIIGSIASNFGPKGQLVSMGLGFVSAILGLFGKAPKQPSLSEVVRKVINEALDEYHDQSLTDKAHGVIKALSDSKAYLDGVAKVGKPLNLEQMKLASSRVPIVQGSEFMGELYSVTFGLFSKNLNKDAERAIKYAELYVRMETLRDMILTQYISLTNDDDDLKFDVEGLVNMREKVRKGTKALLENIYVINYSSYIIPHFDPDNSPVTDTYARILLNMGKYDRSLAGQEYCLVYSDGQDLGWERSNSKFKVKGNPYLVTNPVNNYNCYWKLVPHGKNTYSIVNRYGCSKKYDYCNALLSWNTIDGVGYATIGNNGPVLWEIWGYNYRRITNKWGCDTGHKFCDQQLRIANRKLGFWDCPGRQMCNKNVGTLLPSDGKYHWRLRKRV